MNNYKDTHELYKSVLDEVHAPDVLKKRIKKMNTKQSKAIKIKLISAASAKKEILLC